MPLDETLNADASVIDRRIDETLVWLCGIASPTGEERALADQLLARVRKLTLPAEPRRYRDSIVVPLTRSRTTPGEAPLRPRIALVGHTDTVKTENGPAHIEGDRCFGAGSSDMKSGLAVMLALAETVHPAFFQADVTLVFYAREEGPFAENELALVLEKDPDLSHVDLAVCMEPSDNRLHVGCVGSVHATVTFEGKTGHSARPWEADNAITKAAPFLAEVGRLAPVESHVGGFVYRSVTTVTRANDGGRGRNVVPDRFVLNVNHRFAPDRSLEDAKKHVLDLVAGRARVEFTDLSPAALPHTDHPLVAALARAGARSIEPKQAWTDVARFAALGIPSTNFGPGENAQAHQPNESTSLALVHEGYAIMRRWLTGNLSDRKA